MELCELIRIQEALKKRIDPVYSGSNVQFIAGCDVAYTQQHSIACVVVLKMPEMDVVESSFHTEKTRFSYIPGFFAFREAHIIALAIAKIETAVDVFILDGHGTAHPRRMGLATYTGILVDKPTIGCAKSLLTGTYHMPGNKKGDFSIIMIENEAVGICLRTKTNSKPVFVSPGNHMDIGNSIKIVLQCTTNHKTPEPLRLAHIFANRKKIMEN
ncbi:MAG: endonuclease V [Candidatus Omnitrophica bacterium]|nr:endonuclease V [Candidatus Omnitrophota bacterium]MCM8788610.1 endonuclease V [Candidatus Omnitrophota bacterium]